MRRKSGKPALKECDSDVDGKIDSPSILGFDDDFFDTTTVTFPPPKKQLTIRLDEDVLVWLKGKGRGYHTWINAILRAYYEAHKHETADRPE